MFWSKGTPSSRSLSLFISAQFRHTDAGRSQDWIRCNDELIEPTPVPKKSGKNKEVHDGLDSSKDAYMLVYARRQPAITPIDPPAAVMEAVEASNTALQVSQAEWQEK